MEIFKHILRRIENNYQNFKKWDWKERSNIIFRIRINFPSHFSIHSPAWLLTLIKIVKKLPWISLKLQLHKYPTSFRPDTAAKRVKYHWNYFTTQIKCAYGTFTCTPLHGDNNQNVNIILLSDHFFFFLIRRRNGERRKN